ncbi:MAG TPA: hypothetical protein VHJ38_06140 [Nitrososphaeraceae archaeon]|nr:hypothetical protein [Nitrososphaeraceae archaeon]
MKSNKSIPSYNAEYFKSTIYLKQFNDNNKNKKGGSLRLMYVFYYMSSSLVFQSKELQAEPSSSVNNLKKYS